MHFFVSILCTMRARERERVKRVATAVITSAPAPSIDVQPAERGRTIYITAPPGRFFVCGTGPCDPSSLAVREAAVDRKLNDK